MVDVSWPVIYEAPCPTLALGSRRFDIRHRAVVMGLVDGRAGLDGVLSVAEGLVDEGAAALDLGTFEAVDDVVPVVRSLHERFDVPLCIATSRSEVLPAALAAGAAVWNDTTGRADLHDLAAIHAAGASVILPSRSADDGEGSTADSVIALREAAGLAPERVSIDIRTLALLRGSQGPASLGSPLCLTSSGGGGSDRGGAIAAVALGISLGVRLVRTRDGRGARRTADVMAAVLEAREPVSP